MNQTIKPKQPKLWKNASGIEKNKSKKSKFGSVKSAPNSMIKNETQNTPKSEINDHDQDSQQISKEKKVSFSIPATETEVNIARKSILKRKSENTDDQPSPDKKAKITTLKKERKLLQKKKNKNFETILKRKSENTDNQSSPDKKAKITTLKKKERKLLQKKKNKNFEITQTLKQFWEELRREDCKPERKSVLLKQVCDLIKGRVKEFTFAHDTVRILECVLSNGAETHRSLLFEELKNDIIPLAKSKYGKFFLLKVLRYGTKQHKGEIMKAFHGKVISLIRHVEAAEVVETVFNECANASQRSELVQEFYGASYKYFKDANIHSLSALFEKKPENKPLIMKNMKEQLMRVLEKSVVKHSIVHYVLLQFMNHCDSSSRSEVIEAIREVVPEILHTKDGSRVAMQCIWHGTMKDRKIIVKCMKTFIAKIANEEHGHMVLLALFDCVDDTVLLQRHVIKELMSNLLELCQDVHGKKVLIYLINPRDPHYFHPDVINILKGGDNNETSKKKATKRWSELKELVTSPLLQLISSNISVLYQNNPFCLFALQVLQHVVGDKIEAFQSISALAKEPYTSETKNRHVIEVSGSSFLFKKLILWDKHEWEENAVDESATFSGVLINTLPKGIMKSWMECNRGAFLLVNLLETGMPTVVKRVKEEMEGCKKHLSKKSFTGAQILLRKLKE